MKMAAFALMACGFFSSVESAWADAFFLSNGAFTTFNVPGANPGTTVATGINGSGQIVGFFNDTSDRHGFLDTNGIFTRVDFPGSTFTEALGINNAGQIVGLSYNSTSTPQAFLESNGTFSVIESAPSGASAINNTGQIVGSVGSGNETSFVYTNGIARIITLPFNNVLFSEGHSINDSGQVVGVYFTPTTPGAHGFLDANGVFSTIDVPGATGTYSYGINNSGQIVGFYSDQIGSQQFFHGYLDNNSLFTTIDVPASTDTIAYSINATGEIVGSFTPTPEPTSFVLLASGLTTLGLLIRAGRRNTL